MEYLRESDIVSSLLESIVIFDEDNIITHKGSIISALLESKNYEIDNLVFDEDGSKTNIIKAANHIRNTSSWTTFTLTGIDEELILFTSNLKESGNVILAFKKQIFKISQIKFELNERVKELECLYNISNELTIVNDWTEALETCSHDIVRGFQFPEITSVRIVFKDKVYGSSTSIDSPVMNSLTKYFVRNMKAIGEITVSYHDNQEFLIEEKKLLTEITSVILKEDERREKTKALEKRKLTLQSKNKELINLTKECQGSQEKLRTFFRAITDVIMVIDQDFNIIMSNKVDVRNGGKCYKELFGRDINCEQCPAARTFYESGPETEEVMYEDKTLSLQSYPIINGSNIVEQVLEVCRDITKEKELEFELVQSSKLASLGKLVAGVAHEINNPNTYILGNLGIIKEAMTDIVPLLDKLDDKEEVKIARLNYQIFKDNIMTLINDMEGGAVRIKKIVEDLRNYAKKDDEDLSDLIDINDIINHTVRLVEKQVKRKARIEYKLEANLPPCRGNIPKLEQVFINMVINAAQAIEHDEGVIKIFTSYSKENKEVIISVIDNGKGMDEKTRKNVFDPFFTTKRNSGGTGLGLSITYGIIDAHKGRIEINSRVNEGTEFIIYIPTAENE